MLCPRKAATALALRNRSSGISIVVFTRTPINMETHGPYQSSRGQFKVWSDAQCLRSKFKANAVQLGLVSRRA